MKLVIIASLLLSISAHAGSFAKTEKMHLPALKGSETRVDQLANMYSQGTTVTADQAFGWWAGRCYSAQAPNKVYGSMLMVVAAPESSAQSFKMAIVENRNQPNFIFDNLAAEDKKTFALRDSEMMKLNSFESDEALQSQYAGGNAAYSVRQGKNYFLGLVSAIAADGDIQAGTILKACYFFKKVN